MYWAAYVVSHHKTKDEDNTPLDDDVPDLSICQEIFGRAPKTEKTDC